MKPRGTGSGFTLLELLIVLAVMTLALAMVPPLLSSVGLTTELRGSARQLAAAMRVARSRAATKQQEAVVTVDLEQRRFTVSGSEGSGRALPDDEEVTLRLYTARSELIDDAVGQIRFFPDGTSTGGYVALADERVEYRVSIDWLTGHVAVEERTQE